MHLMNNAPHTQVFQFTLEGPDGEPNTQKLIMEPGEVVEIDDDDDWAAMEADSRVRHALDQRRLIASVDPGSKQHQDYVHGIVNNRLGKQYIGELSKTARETDIEEDGQDQNARNIIGQAEQKEAEKFRKKARS